MPLCSLYLLSIDPSVSVEAVVEVVRAKLDRCNQPLTVGKVVRWIIPPWLNDPSSTESSGLEVLQSTRWDLLLIFPKVSELPQQCRDGVNHLFSLQVGIPSKLISDFENTNSQLLHPSPEAIPPTTDTPRQIADSTKDLELTAELLKWSSGASHSGVKPPRGAVSMLNLLSFPDDPAAAAAAKSSYQKYGQAFAERVGSRHGGHAKLVGNVIQPSQTAHNRIATGDQSNPWNEIALAHYPSIEHFTDMVGSKEYQEVNTRYRKGSLRGTAILCCDELDESVLPNSRTRSREDDACLRMSKL